MLDAQQYAGSLTTSGRAKGIVKQGVADRNGMVAFGRIGERSGKTGW